MTSTPSDSLGLSSSPQPRGTGRRLPRTAALAAVWALAVAGCAKKSSGAAAPVDAAEAYAPTGDPAQDLAAYEQQLAQAEAELRGLGVPTPLPDTIAKNAPRGAETEQQLGADLAEGEPGDPALDTQDEREVDDDAEAGPTSGVPAAPPTEAAEREEAAPTSGGRTRVRLRDRGSDAPSPQERCRTICDVATTVCELEGKICGLADAHADDARYLDACARAQTDCTTAEEACRACAP